MNITRPRHKRWRKKGEDDRLIPETDSRRDVAHARTAIGTSALLLAGTWVGLVTGLLEMGLRLGQQLWDHHVTVESIRTNHHWIWMAPVSDALIFGACGLLLGLLVRLLPRSVSRIAPYLLGFLAFLALLLTVKAMHWIACVVLACGLAVRTAALIEVHSRRFRRLVRLSFPFLASVVAVVGAAVGSHVSLRDSRLPASLPGAHGGRTSSYCDG